MVGTDPWAYPVHPHACGEYFFWGNDHDLGFGSSPRVWGIQLKIIPQRYWPRFIPTRVGNTPQVVASTTITAVHPHACGEYLNWDFTRPAPRGSSPRVWGILRLCNTSCFLRRFIPTRVGNTLVPKHAENVNTVHPHACGEYAHDCCVVQGVGGSSPRVWGIRFYPTNEQEQVRFIPTRVGNTSTNRATPLAISVHPHACGEYTSSISLSYRK